MYPTTPDRPLKIALDVEELVNTAKGQRVINALMDGEGEQFRTKRGRLAILSPLDRFERIRRVHRFTTEDSFDGLKAVRLEARQEPASV